MKNSPCQLYAWHLKIVYLIGSLSSQSRKFQVTKIYVLWLVLWSWLRRTTLRKRLLDSSFGFHYLKQTTGAWKSWRSFWENPCRNHVVLGYASINKTFLHISLSRSSKHFLKWAARSISAETYKELRVRLWFYPLLLWLPSNQDELACPVHELTKQHQLFSFDLLRLKILNPQHNGLPLCLECLWRCAVACGFASSLSRPSVVTNWSGYPWHQPPLTHRGLFSSTLGFYYKIELGGKLLEKYLF